MTETSLCGCLVRLMNPATGYVEPTKAWTTRMARHYYDYPECKKVAGQDPVWRARRKPHA